MICRYVYLPSIYLNSRSETTYEAGEDAEAEKLSVAWTVDVPDIDVKLLLAVLPANVLEATPTWPLELNALVVFASKVHDMPPKTWAMKVSS